MAINHVRYKAHRTVLSVAVTLGLLCSATGSMAQDMPLLFLGADNASVSSPLQSSPAQRSATDSAAERAASGGADSTETYVIKRLEEQAIADGNTELLALLASAPSDEASAQLAGELTPDRSGANVYGAILAQDQFTQAIKKRTSDYLLGDSARSSLWVTYLGSDNRSFINSEGTNRYDGFDSTSSGFAIGYDKILSNEFLMGIAFSQQKVDASGRLYNNRTEIESYQASLYAIKGWNNFYLTGRGVVGWNANTTSRQIGESSGYDGNTDATARFNSQNLSLQLELTHAFYWQNFSLSPLVSANYTYVRTEDYSENYVREYNNNGVLVKDSGSPAALAYDQQNYDELNLGAGFETAYSLDTKVGVFQTRLGVNANFEVLDTNLTTTARLASGGDSFTVGVNNGEDVSYETYLDLAWETNGSFTWNLGVQRTWDDSSENDMFYGKAIYSF